MVRLPMILSHSPLKLYIHSASDVYKCIPHPHSGLPSLKLNPSHICVSACATQSMETGEIGSPLLMKDANRFSQLNNSGVSGPDNDRTIFPTSLCGPKISGPHNDWSLSTSHCVVVVWSWSLSGPGRCLVQVIVWSWSLSGPGRCLVLVVVWSWSLSGPVTPERCWPEHPYITTRGAQAACEQ